MKPMLAYRYLTDVDTIEALARGWSLYGDPAHACDAAAGTMRCGQAVKEVDADYDPDLELGEF
jgi:hypothetical protein